MLRELSAPAGARVWWVDTAAYRHTVPGSLHVLDARETARAAAFLREADRETYLCAHLALRRLLGEHLGVAPGAVRFTRGPHGAPAVADSPWRFSLAHSGAVSLVALSRAPVGVDVEALPEPGTVERVTGALHPREAHEIRAAAPADRPAAFARAWTRKEAYLKALGTGLTRDTAADHTGAGPRPARLPGWRLTDLVLPVPDTHRAALATRVGGAPDRPPGTSPPPPGTG
ncbi:4'-phosphopantetheinyl transferase family protein [Streptomyces subrutilus]|uniref:4'-phosphopantetheinyl transferase n=1 Tax=Streptomyces subrutilus TaxID=36818 RepID=A0A5P2UH99_9ACTN|nr:4'-phosphopantetheinyl transferase superfamily protein [Streptomyces subrutilus]QEU77845.1 4'-phosphopantetheinyl transferase superfamily protein [Streptomyces subrutilus]WSJ33014.1 4'-phosphopantetheinyl transferase superfamily protein [Streptomyces subrutilus]GGZ62745.1 4'-phosphopantetheinyl transferase [Streptomyces subrutilus]